MKKNVLINGVKRMQKLYRSRTDKKIAGVCGGLAKIIGIDSTIVRVIVAMMSLFGGIGLMPYLICALIIPMEPEEQNENIAHEDYEPRQ